jgi:hypothetical protein
MDDSTNDQSYDRPYIANTDTQWISNPNAPNPTTGQIQAGDRAYFNRDPDLLATWQDAVYDGSRRFVHPGDFSAAADSQQSGALKRGSSLAVSRDQSLLVTVEIERPNIPGASHSFSAR